MASIVYISNDNLLELQDLKDVAADEYVNDATVTVTLKDSAGDNVSGQSWPATMSYVASSNGKYRATLDEELSLTAGKRYVAEVDADAGSDLKGHWKLTVQADNRGSS